MSGLHRLLCSVCTFRTHDRFFKKQANISFQPPPKKKLLKKEARVQALQSFRICWSQFDGWPLCMPCGPSSVYVSGFAQVALDVGSGVRTGKRATPKHRWGRVGGVACLTGWDKYFAFGIQCHDQLCKTGQAHSLPRSRWRYQGGGVLPTNSARFLVPCGEDHGVGPPSGPEGKPCSPEHGIEEKRCDKWGVSETQLTAKGQSPERRISGRWRVSRLWVHNTTQLQ